MKMEKQIIPIYRIRMVLTTDVYPIYTIEEWSYLGKKNINVVDPQLFGD